MSDTALVPYAPQAVTPAGQVSLGLLNADSPRALIGAAAAIANALAEVVERQKLFSDIQGKKYVHVQGWTTLIAMLNITVREAMVAPLPGGQGWIADVELVSRSTGVAIGRGSAICTRDERRWGKADEYAVRSMAITRAVGKACRMNFDWIMALAGYEGTPFEEMPQDEKTTPPSRHPQPKPFDRQRFIITVEKLLFSIPPEGQAEATQKLGHHDCIDTSEKANDYHAKLKAFVTEYRARPVTETLGPEPEWMAAPEEVVPTPEALRLEVETLHQEIDGLATKCKKTAKWRRETLRRSEDVRDSELAEYVAHLYGVSGQLRTLAEGVAEVVG